MSDTPQSLTELERQLRFLSHDDTALKLIQGFAASLGKTKNRQDVFHRKGALIRSAILYERVRAEKLIEPTEDPFSFLQGDIIYTDSAYFLGERITGSKFAIATSTCDLVPGRRDYALLLRIQPIRSTDKDARQIIGELLKFSSTKRMYLPPLPDDEADVVANAVIFDGMFQIRLADLLLARRFASLSLVGWRIFGSLIRSIMVRAGESEVNMRISLESIVIE